MVDTRVYMKCPVCGRVVSKEVPIELDDATWNTKLIPVAICNKYRIRFATPIWWKDLSSGES